jgi:VCBS repeat-containing protein
MIEWWRSPEAGLEQGWTLTRRPSGGEGAAVLLEVGITHDLAPVQGQHGQSIDLVGPATLQYGGLIAFDAAGSLLPAVMTGAVGAITIAVDDSAAVYPITIDPFVQSKKLIASSADPSGQPGDNDRFGLSAAIDGDRVIVGAPFVDVPETNAGWGYIFERDEGGTDNWGLVKDFSGNFGSGDNQAGDSLGWRTAIDGDIAAISHTGEDEGASDAGAVSVLYRNLGGNNNWGRIRKLIPASPQSTSILGSAVAIEGDTIVAGGEGHDESGFGTNSGGLWIFVKDLGGADTWGQVTGGRIPTPGLTAGDSLGAAVDVSGDIVVAGMPTEDSGGEVHIYYRNRGGANNWGHLKAIVGSDVVAGHRFGSDVAISGDTIVVGTPHDSANRGAAYVFERNEGGADNWGQTQKLVAADGANGHQFGDHLDVEGSNLVVSATQAFGSGKAYHFTESGGTWTQQQRFGASDGAGGDAFGGAVALSGSTVIIGAPQDDSFRGSAYIFDLNSSPVANDDSYNGVVSGGTLTVAVAQGTLSNDTDPENDVLTASKATDPANGNLTAFNADGSFAYVADGGFVGTDTFTYKANDGNSDSGTATVSITVATSNVAPVANDDAYSVAEDATLNLAAAAGVLDNDTDANGDGLTAAGLTTTSNGTLALNGNGSFTYTPNADFNGTDSFTYRANDGSLNSGTATVTITVNAVNDPPVAIADSYSVNEDATLTVGVVQGLLSNDTDTEGDALTAIKVTDAANGTLDAFGATGAFTYTPNPNFNGTDSFTYKSNDGAADSGTVTVTITVGATNDAPVAVADAFTVDEDATLTVAAGQGVLANDTDTEGGALTAAKVTDPANGTLNTFNADGSLTYTPDANFDGTDTFTYKANDGAADSGVATVTITVSAVNDAPVAAADSYAVDEDTTLTRNPAAGVLSNDTDIEGDSLTAIKVTEPGNGTLEAFGANGSFTYTPNADFNGTDAFTYKANDGAAGSGAVTVTITVGAANDAPVAVADDYSVDEDTTLTKKANTGVLANDTDSEGDSLTAIKVTDPANGTLDAFGADGAFTYTPSADFSGTDSFTYKANDGAADSGAVTVTITVGASNDAPVAVADTYTVDEDTILTRNANTGVLANDTDPDGDALTATQVTDPANGTLSASANGSFTYTPDANFNGTDTFTYTANDGVANSAIATVTITVNAVLGAVTLVDDSYDTVAGKMLSVPVTSGVLVNDTGDLDSDARARADTSPSGGTLTFNADGSFEYEPDAGFNGTDRFNYSVDQDNDGTFDVSGGTVSIRVAACSFTLDSSRVSVEAAGGTGTVNVTTDADCEWEASSDSDWLTADATSNGSRNRRLSASGPGSIRYTAVANATEYPRTGALTIGSERFTVRQKGVLCNYSFDVSSVQIDSGLADFKLGVETATGCAWSVMSSAAWIFRTAEGTGAGVARLRADFNGSSSARTALVAVYDPEGMVRATATVVQRAACTGTLLPSRLDLGSDGGSSDVRVETQEGCSWQLVPNAPWLRAVSSGIGSGSPTIVWDPNVGNAPRAARFDLRVEQREQVNATLSVEQGPSGCQWTFPIIHIPAEGVSRGSSPPGVEASVREWSRRCQMGNLQNEPAWLNARTQGSSSGVFAFARATANPTSAVREVELQDRSGNTMRFRQEAGAGCRLRLTPRQRDYSLDMLAHELEFSLRTQPGCEWELWDTSQTRGVLTVWGARAEPAGGGTFVVSVNPNRSAQERVGVLKVAGEEITVRQLAGANNTNRFRALKVVREQLDDTSASVKITWRLIAGSPAPATLVVRHVAWARIGKRREPVVTEHILNTDNTRLDLTIPRDARGRSEHWFYVAAVSLGSQTQPKFIGSVRVPQR